MENWNVFESPVPLKEYKLTPGVQIRVRSKTFGRLHIAPEEQEGEAELLIGEVNELGGLCDDCRLHPDTVVIADRVLVRLG